MIDLKLYLYSSYPWAGRDFLELIDAFEVLVSSSAAEELQQLVDHACSWQV